MRIAKQPVSLLIVLTLIWSLAHAAWQPPINLGSMVNSAYYDMHPCLSPDGRFLFFNSTRPGGTGGYDLWVSEKMAGVWQTPVNLGPAVNSSSNDYRPYVSADGQTLYFDSDRPGGYGATDIYYSTFSGGAWQLAQTLGADIDTTSSEYYACITPDGLTLYFGSDRPGGYGLSDIWQANFVGGHWQTPVNLGPNINTSANDSGVRIAPDLQTLYFQRYGWNGYPGWDIYYSQLFGGQWAEAVNMGTPVNSGSDDAAFFLLPDLSGAYFGSARPGGYGGWDIYVSYAQAYSISGTITFSDNSTKAVATVRAFDSETMNCVAQVTTMPGGGDYAITVYKNGTYDLVVSAVRYTTDSLTLHGLVVSGTDLTGQDVELQRITSPTHSISGNVSFFDAFPQAIATVTLYENDRDVPVESDVVGPGAGSYLLPDIPDGIYDIKVTASGYKEDNFTLADTIVSGTNLTNKNVLLTIAQGAVWMNLCPEGEIPPPRRGASAIYDDLHHRMLIFGGQNLYVYTPPDGHISHLNDLYELDLTNNIWTELHPSGTIPSIRRFHSAILDSARRRMIIFGGWPGYQAPYAVVGDCFAYDLDTNHWDELVTTGTIPSARGAHQAIYDDLRDRMILFGDSGDLNTYSLDLSTNNWSVLGVSGITAEIGRMLFSAVHDRIRDRMLIYAGNHPGSSYDDLFALTLGAPCTWDRPGSPDNLPQSRRIHTAIIDETENRMVVFGGSTPGITFPAPAYLDDALGYDLTTDHWAPIQCFGKKPHRRAQHVAIYDPQNDAMVIFSGLYYERTYLIFNDTYALYFHSAPLVVRISDSLTALPIEGATASISQIDDLSSDEIGEVCFMLPPGKLFDLFVSAPGYDLQTLNGVSSTMGTITRVSIALTPLSLGAVVGRVTSASTGDPIVGANVAVSGAGSDLTDSQGKYQIGSVAQGSAYTVSVSATGYLSKQQDAVVVTGGMTTCVNFELIPAGKGTISGTVADRDSGAAIPGALVTATGPGSGSDETDAQGEYILFLPAGTNYTVSTSAPGYLLNDGSSRSGLAVVVGGDTLADLTLTDANTIPAAPTGLTLTPGDRLIDLRWNENAESDLVGYNIYRRVGSGSYGPRTNVSPVSVTYFRNTHLSNGTTYYYRITAVDRDGNESAPSSEAGATPLNFPPQPPYGLRASLLNGGVVRLDWLPSPSPDILKYTVYCDNATGAIDYTTSGAVGQVNAGFPGWVSGPLTPGQRYKFGVRTMDTSYQEEQNTDVVVEVTPVMNTSGLSKVHIVSPAGGTSISGNQVTVEAEIMEGFSPNIQYVAFEYKPVGATVWLAMESLDGANQSPDYYTPYFIFWNTSTLSPGDYEIRAVAWNLAGNPDTDPIVYRVKIVASFTGFSAAARRSCFTDGMLASPAGELASLSPQELGCDVIEFINSVGEHVRMEKVSSQSPNTVRCGGAQNRIIQVYIPQGAIDNDTYLAITLCNADFWREKITPANVCIDVLINLQLTSGQEVLSSELSLPYADTDQDGIVDETTVSESTLALNRLDSSSFQWNRVSATLDANANQIVANLSTMGVYAVFSTSNIATIPANKHGWLYAGRTLLAGWNYDISGGFGSCNNGGTTTGPDGQAALAPSGWLVPGARKLALVGKVGRESSTFFIGTTSVHQESQTQAPLYLGYNEDQSSVFGDNSGFYRVSHSVSPPPAPPATAVSPALWHLYE